MKISTLLLVAGLATLGCKKTEIPVTIRCNSTRNYAKSISQAAGRLIGIWRLSGLSVGWGQPPAVPDQLVEFKADGTCTVTRDGQRSGPFAYSLAMQTAVGSPEEVPHLLVSDSTQPDQPFRRLGTSRLFSCDEELNLDYGSAIDGPTYTYSRQSR